MMRWLVASVCLLWMAGCPSPQPAPPPAAPVVNPSPPWGPPAAAPDRQTPAELQRPRREVAVGGCGQACDAPREALEAFFRATLAGDRVALRTHLETSLLEADGILLGARWAEQWASGQLPARSTEIDKWCDGWLARAGTPLDPVDKTRGVSSFQVLSDSQRRWVVEWTSPPTAREGARRWTVTLTRRGLEWLVSGLAPAPPQLGSPPAAEAP